jgi:deazaflavin-dependent oxidoreductase (nitroreductase family)
MGLGGVLGERFLLLSHRGRKSGRIYDTLLEVVLYQPSTQTSFVMSAQEESPDWYRNIEAQPAITVQVGKQRYTPVQHFLTPDEAIGFWVAFRSKHPIEKKLALQFYSQPGKEYRDNDARREALLGALHVVSFRPPQPVQALRELRITNYQLPSPTRNS